VNLQELRDYALTQVDANNRAGETAVARLWRQLAETADQIIYIEARIAANALAKAARRESWKR
jgi:urease accessory protein UreF